MTTRIRARLDPPDEKIATISPNPSCDLEAYRRIGSLWNNCQIWSWLSWREKQGSKTNPPFWMYHKSAPSFLKNFLKNFMNSLPRFEPKTRRPIRVRHRRQSRQKRPGESAACSPNVKWFLFRAISLTCQTNKYVPNKLSHRRMRRSIANQLPEGKRRNCKAMENSLILVALKYHIKKCNLYM